MARRGAEAQRKIKEQGFLEQVKKLGGLRLGEKKFARRDAEKNKEQGFLEQIKKLGAFAAWREKKNGTQRRRGAKKNKEQGF